MVTRPSEVKVRYLDRQGNATELQASGLMATCLQHEIDHLNGYVVGSGKALGIPTPVNRVLHTLVKLLESK